jgi:TRAP transporter 4TM/12TM fusion protein
VTGSEETEAPSEATPANLWQLPNRYLFVTVTGTLLSIVAGIYIIFNLGATVGYVPLETQYFYVLLTVLLPTVFIIFPFRRGLEARTAVPFYDVLLAVAAFGIGAYFTVNGNAIIDEGWEYAAPDLAVYLCYAYWLLVLDALRRTGGTAVFVVAAIFSVYPVVAHLAPGFLEGPANDWSFTATYHVFGTESVVGIPMDAFANLVIGFLVFGVALQHTGGGAFFLNLAFALLGRYRGGPAKVAIFGSGLMGSMSGSVITNVLTTGVMTIPAMRRVGFSPAYAGGVEACASTGGTLLPPIMGATAFVMAVFLEIPYTEILVAAIIPSLLYYLGLFLQIDAYAARHGLHGLPDEELPKVRDVMRDGWYFIAVFVLLIVMLVGMQRESQAPFYATAALLVINQLVKTHRWDLSKAVAFVVGVGRLFAELAAMLAGVGLIIGALSLTGKVGTLAFDLVRLAGDSTLLLLVMGALTSFVLGIGMTVTAAYLFLAITLAPALTTGGLDPMAVHLFMLYWAMISFITPPVAIGAFAAATVANARPMQTGVEAMRLGTVIYFVPFFFVLNPALIGKAPAGEVLLVASTAIVGIVLIAAGLQGYLLGVGSLPRMTGMMLVARALLILGGLTFAMPGGDLIGYSHGELLVFAAAISLVAVGLAYRVKSEPQVVNTS